MKFETIHQLHEDDLKHGSERGFRAALRFIQRESRTVELLKQNSHEDFCYRLALTVAERAITDLIEREGEKESTE